MKVTTLRACLLSLTALIGMGTAGPLSADTSFWVRNTDPATLVWWPVPAGVRGEALLALLPGVAPGPRAVAPGERVRVTLGDGQDLAAAFVDETRPSTFRTVVSGGVVAAAQVPAQGTVLVNARALAAANPGRALAAPLQAWGLVPPTLALGGAGWSSVPPALAWGSSFQPGGKAWPPGWPRVQSLQVADQDGALWVALTADRPWTALPPGVRVTLALRRPGAFLEWPLAGDPTVWLWNEGAAAQPVGWSAQTGAVVQGWIPWNRLSDDDAAAWRRASGRWALVVTRGDDVTVADLGSFAFGELP